MKLLTVQPVAASMEYIYNPNSVTNRQYQTSVLYRCPTNSSFPTILASNFTFNFKNLTNGFVYNLTAVCHADG